jgi:tetratricopeptide (TPR) repeat protein
MHLGDRVRDARNCVCALIFQHRSKEAATLRKLFNQRSNRFKKLTGTFARLRGRTWLWLGIGICLINNSGCQSFHPFAQKTRDSIRSASQWACGGMEAVQKGRLDQAKGFFSKAAEENPNDFRVRANLARTLYQSGEKQQAIGHMQQAVELSRGDSRMQVELGEMYLDAGQWIPARRQAQVAIETNHRFAPAWALRGKTEKAKGNYDQALADFQKALGYAPDMTSVQMQIVDTYQKMGQPLLALSAVEQVLNSHSFDQQPEEAIVAKGVALINLDLLSPAIELLETASRRDKASSEVFVRLGQAQLLAGQTSQARLTLNRGKQAFPDLVVFDQLVEDLQSPKQHVVSVENAGLLRR